MISGEPVNSPGEGGAVEEGQKAIQKAANSNHHPPYTIPGCVGWGTLQPGEQGL